MIFPKVILDADICLKLGAHTSYDFLENLLPAISDKIYMHKVVLDEIKYPHEIKVKITKMVADGKIEVLDESQLGKVDKILYLGALENLKKVMVDPRDLRESKNLGEASSLAMAKILKIPYFCTDEKNLQNIVDKNLNQGTEYDISCVRIIDIIKKIRNNEIEGFNRKKAKGLWTTAGYPKEIFDEKLWPLD